MQISDVMTPSVEVIDPNATIRDATVKMRDAHVGAIPVRENGRLVGVVTDRDIVVRGLAESRLPGTTAVREVM